MTEQAYTMDHWRADRDFKARPGQEVSPDVYEEMLNVMPPIRLSEEAAAIARDRFGILRSAGFLMGEPHASDQDGPLYLAFVSTGGKCYFIGTAHGN